MAEEEEALALDLGVDRCVEGWLATYAQGVRDRQARGAEAHIDYGVDTPETIRRYGGIGITLECGQHEDNQAPQIAYRAIRGALAHMGMAAAEPRPLPSSQPEVIRLHKVIDRLHPDDRLCRDWRSFEEIKQGDVLALRHDGAELTADQDGWIVFPNPTAQVDQAWFYLAKKSDRLMSLLQQVVNAAFYALLSFRCFEYLNPYLPTVRPRAAHHQPPGWVELARSATGAGRLRSRGCKASIRIAVTKCHAAAHSHWMVTVSANWMPSSSPPLSLMPSEAA